jgi:hypothetical protein
VASGEVGSKGFRAACAPFPRTQTLFGHALFRKLRFEFTAFSTRRRSEAELRGFAGPSGAWDRGNGSAVSQLPAQAPQGAAFGLPDRGGGEAEFRGHVGRGATQHGGAPESVPGLRLDGRPDLFEGAAQK